MVICYSWPHSTHDGDVGIFPLPSCVPHHRASLCEFERGKQAVVILAVNNYMIVRGQQLLTYTRRCSFIELLAPLAQEIELKQVIAKHDKDDLVDHHRKGAGGEMSEIAKALKLTVSLLCGRSKMVCLVRLAGILDILSVDQEPRLPVAIGIVLTGGHNTQW